MFDDTIKNYLKGLLQQMPKDWLTLTTHRLDIYDESLAKTEFLSRLNSLYKLGDYSSTSLSSLPTAYDYIRLGHPLSSVLEWAISKNLNCSENSVISFDSTTIPILSVLRKNLIDRKKTRIVFNHSIPENFDAETIQQVYGYDFKIIEVSSLNQLSKFDGSTVFVQETDDLCVFEKNDLIDFQINIDSSLGSILKVNHASNEMYIPAIQHVRRRETIAMTPQNCLLVLQSLVGDTLSINPNGNLESNRKRVVESIKNITSTNSKTVLASSGLSMQYAIMMGLIDFAQKNHPRKDIKFIVPPNCYGGTNDQARRVAACVKNIEVLDLPVDGGQDMNEGIDQVLDLVAEKDAVPYIIAEIPTNPRVEVPELQRLKEVLSKPRKTKKGDEAVASVFILDQTFCPNVQFLGENNILSSSKAISYVSGSKFPSGGKCTAGYCVANTMASEVMNYIEKHLLLCDNEATPLQYEILAGQLPSMNQRIEGAYKNTRSFVKFIQEHLPTAKINFVSEELAARGFTPSVFSLDLPTQGNTEEAREAYKRALNLKLINLMIDEIPEESKFCVSYGQLKGCYWTIPATSTQGTTKESDKDYIVRVALAPEVNLEKHQEVFKSFVDSIS